MAYKYMKNCLHLNQLLTQAWSKEVEGLTEAADRILLDAKAALTDVLKGFSHDPNIKLFVELQAELCEMMATTGNPNPKKCLIRIIKRVSEAFPKQSKGKNIDNLIMVNMELSQALVDSSQENLISVLSVLSKAIMWLCGQNVQQFFELNDFLSQALAAKLKDRKLDLLFELNRFLSMFMYKDYPDASISLLMQLNHKACLAIKERLEYPYPINLMYANKLLSQLMKITSDETLLQKLIELNGSLAGIFLQRDIKLKYGQLIEWKLQLSHDILKFAGQATLGEKERLSSLPDVLKKTNSEEVATIPNANKLRVKSSKSRQQYHNKQLGDTKELNGEPRAEVPVGGERSTAAVVAEVPEGRSSVKGEKEGVAEGTSSLMKIPGKIPRSKRDLMTTIYLPPVTLGRKKLTR